MPNFRPVLGRRPALGFLLALPLIRAARGAGAQTPGGKLFPEGTSLLTAGPEAGELESWSKLLAPHLRRALPADTELRLAQAGGVDGVTGANQFHTSTQPDGFSTLLVPGSAALACLIGDPRVHFEAGRWIGLLSAHSPAVLISRIDPRGFRRGQAVKLAIDSPNGSNLAARLGLELMGLTPVPGGGPAGDAAAMAAFAQRAADLLLLRGGSMAEQIAAAQAAGGQPIATLGRQDGGVMTRDPAQPGLPHLMELAGQIGLPLAGGPILEAWRAVAAAAQLSFALVLPPLTTASMIALWRRVAEQVVAVPEIQAAALIEGVRLRAGPDGLASVSAGPDAIRELRAWLASRTAK